jgi:hypothetical protein
MTTENYAETLTATGHLKYVGAGNRRNDVPGGSSDGTRSRRHAERLGGGTQSRRGGATAGGGVTMEVWTENGLVHVTAGARRIADHLNKLGEHADAATLRAAAAWTHGWMR